MNFSTVNNPTKFLTILIAASLSLSACATKPDRRDSPPKERQSNGPARASGTFLFPISGLFISMDKNQDRATSFAEIDQGIKSEWATFERSPSAINFRKWSIKNLGSTDASPSFIAFDRDFNGIISKLEFRSQIETEFEKLDKNGDRRLERSEMIVAFAAPQGERSRSSGEQGRPERGGRRPR